MRLHSRLTNAGRSQVGGVWLCLGLLLRARVAGVRRCGAFRSNCMNQSMEQLAKTNREVNIINDTCAKCMRGTLNKV